jgi:GTP-binding protein
MSFTLAIVGRPNVGKSTLFNRLVGKRLALVDDQPGVTRDLREGEARLGDLRFTVIDTAGLEEVTDDSLQGRMRKLTERAVAMADACLFVIDARAGVTPSDEVFADILRRKARRAAGRQQGRGPRGRGRRIEAWSLGLGEPIPLSAEHGEGMAELAAALRPLIEAAETTAGADAEAAPETDLDVDEEGEGASFAPTEARPLQIAVVGRPNAGKSTLVNAILGEDRLLTGPEAGITRDAISVRMDWAGTPVRIFDTAGMRKKAQGAGQAREALGRRRAARGALRRGRGGAARRRDPVRDAGPAHRRSGRARGPRRGGRGQQVGSRSRQGRKLAELRERFERLLPQLRGAPLVTVSALTGRGLDRLHDGGPARARGLEPPGLDRPR